MLIMMLVSSSHVLAQSSSDKEKDFFSRSISEQKNAPHSEKVNALKEKGLNDEDAEYYASVDDLVAKFEKEGKVLELDKVTAMSQSDIIADPKGFKKRILAGDPAAIKAGLNSPVMTQGTSDIAKLIEQNPEQERYIVQYSDGSFIEFEQSKGKNANKIDNEVRPLAYDEDQWWYSVNCGGAGGPANCINASANWTFGNGTYWAKAAIMNLDYQVNYNPTSTVWTTSVGSYTPGTSSSGFVSYGSPTINTRSSASYNVGANSFPTANRYAEAQIFFGVTVSGSISGGVNFSFYSLSLSLNAGNNYTQYLMYRVYPDDNGYVGTVAAYFR